MISHGMEGLLPLFIDGILGAWHETPEERSLGFHDTVRAGLLKGVECERCLKVIDATCDYFTGADEIRCLETLSEALKGKEEVSIPEVLRKARELGLSENKRKYLEEDLMDLFFEERFLGPEKSEEMWEEFG